MGFAYVNGFILARDESSLAGGILLRSAQHGWLDATERASMGLLLRHLSRALAIRRRLEVTERSNRCLSDHLADASAMVVVDQNLYVCRLNAAASAILERA